MRLYFILFTIKYLHLFLHKGFHGSLRKTTVKELNYHYSHRGPEQPHPSRPSHKPLLGRRHGGLHPAWTTSLSAGYWRLLSGYLFLSEYQWSRREGGDGGRGQREREQNDESKGEREGGKGRERLSYVLRNWCSITGSWCLTWRKRRTWTWGLRGAPTCGLHPRCLLRDRRRKLLQGGHMTLKVEGSGNWSTYLFTGCCLGSPTRDMGSSMFLLKQL